jgi:hypothetical protein
MGGLRRETHQGAHVQIKGEIQTRELRRQARRQDVCREIQHAAPRALEQTQKVAPPEGAPRKRPLKYREYIGEPRCKPFHS